MTIIALIIILVMQFSAATILMAYSRARYNWNDI